MDNGSSHHVHVTVGSANFGTRRGSELSARGSRFMTTHAVPNHPHTVKGIKANINATFTLD